MAQIPPIEDQYIDDVIKANEPYDPNLNLTQGEKVRELVKLMRDRLEQEIASSAGDLSSKVDKEEGKGLSTNDFTDVDKNRLDNLELQMPDKADKSYVDDKLAAVYKIRPSVPTYDDLPIVGSEVGDVRNVFDTGANYVWTEELGWDKLSETIDFKMGMVQLINLPSAAQSSDNGTGWVRLRNTNIWNLTIPAGTMSQNAMLKVTAQGRFVVPSGVTNVGVVGIRLAVKQGDSIKYSQAMYKENISWSPDSQWSVLAEWTLLHRASGVGHVKNEAKMLTLDGIPVYIGYDPGASGLAEINVGQAFNLEIEVYKLNSEVRYSPFWLECYNAYKAW